MFCQKQQRRSFWAGLVCVGFFFLGVCPAFAADGRIAYQVHAGDTLEQLARLAGFETDLVAAMNGLSEDSALRQGQLIYLPVEPELRITLGEEDTMWSLSRRYDVDLDFLMAYNGISQPERLRTGTAIRIPASSNASANIEPVLAALASRKKINDPWQAPLQGVISSHFGTRKSGFHHGVDIAAEMGSRIHTVKSGTVTFADWKNSIYGYMVTVDHGNGFTSSYAHCSMLMVKVGEKVAAGKSLALVGETGNATGPHVHLELRKNGEIVDPMDYIPLP